MPKPDKHVFVCTEERRRLMQEWADYLDVLRTGSNVIPFKLSR